MAERVCAREMRAIARAVRLVDDRQPPFVELLKLLYPKGGRGYIVGVTGTPGAGKSTLVDRLIGAYRAQGKRVAVVAVDPTSPYTGGAILGDRIRMQRHFLDEGVFIRSLATRGHLGGLSRSARDVIRIFDAAGFDVIIVETVGVGQDELDVARLAHTTVVVTAPGLGDDIQAIKAGILEIADVFAVNKADRPGADGTVRDLEQMIALGKTTGAAVAGRGHSAAMAVAGHDADDDFTPPIVRTVAVRNEGVSELVEACARHRAFYDQQLRAEGAMEQRAEAELWDVFADGLLHQARDQFAEALRKSAAAIARGEGDPYSVSEALIASLLSGGTS